MSSVTSIATPSRPNKEMVIRMILLEASKRGTGINGTEMIEKVRGIGKFGYDVSELILKTHGSGVNMDSIVSYMQSCNPFCEEHDGIYRLTPPGIAMEEANLERLYMREETSGRIHAPLMNNIRQLFTDKRPLLRTTD